MKFDDLDSKMRVFETAQDQFVLPEVYMVARLDGRGFTKLTKVEMDFERPFDVRFRDAMVNTVKHLMNCGFKVVYGYTQSDEISLLFAADENAFGRKMRKYNSVLAGEASSFFSLELQARGVFDCRICQLPSVKNVIDYFRWRNEDAHRNSLNAHCYWLLRKLGKSARQATAELESQTIAFKNELLFQNGVNFNDLPLWQKRGSGLYYEDYQRESENPITGEKVKALRKRIKVDYELPMREEYSAFIEKIIQ